MVEVGSAVDKSWIGKSVVINPTTGWKGESPAMHNLEVLGMPKEGTLAEYVVVDASRVKERPSHLTEVEAASLPLAGVTAYRAVFNQGEAKKGHAVFVTGIGSGVSTFAAQFAAAIGCRVVVSSSSPEKLDEAVKRHALLGGVLYTAPVKEWTRAALDLLGGGSEGFDLIIDGAAGRDFNDLLRMLKPGGRFVSYGGTAGKPVDLDIFRVFLLQLKILGTSMGSDQDFDNMIQFVEDHRITPVIGEIYPWEVRNKGRKRMKRDYPFHHQEYRIIQFSPRPSKLILFSTSSPPIFPLFIPPCSCFLPSLPSRALFQDAIKAIADMAKSNSRGKIVISSPKTKL